MKRHIECEQCGLNYMSGASLEAMLLDSERYQWLRLNPSFESEVALMGLTPLEYDELVDGSRGA